MSEFPIYLRDLNPEVQLELLNFLELDSEKAGNLDEFPVAQIPYVDPLSVDLEEEGKKEEKEEVEVCCLNCAHRISGDGECGHFPADNGKDLRKQGCTHFKSMKTDRK